MFLNFASQRQRGGLYDTRSDMSITFFQKKFDFCGKDINHLILLDIKIKKILSQGLSLCHLAYKLLHNSLYSITGQGYKTGFRLQKSTHRITLYLKNCKTFVLYAAV